jgi:hypothetical protein
MSEANFSIVENHPLLEFAKQNLKWVGVLKQVENGYTFLKIDDDFIRKRHGLIT